MLLCPYCAYKFDYNDLYEEFVNIHDYETWFDSECKGCNKTIEVEVEAVPEFVLHKK